MQNLGIGRNQALQRYRLKAADAHLGGQVTVTGLFEHIIFERILWQQNLEHVTADVARFGALGNTRHMAVCAVAERVHRVRTDPGHLLVAGQAHGVALALGLATDQRIAQVVNRMAADAVDAAVGMLRLPPVDVLLMVAL